MRAGRDRLRKAERDGLRRGIERNLGGLRAVVDAGAPEIGVDRIEDEPRRRLAHLDIDDFDTGKRKTLQIRRQLDRVVDGNDCLRQFSGRSVEGETGSANAAPESDSSSAMVAAAFRSERAGKIAVT